MKKYDPLADEVTERSRLTAILRDAVITQRVKKNDFSAVASERMTKTVEMLAETLKLPAVESSKIYNAAYLPPARELATQ